MFTHLKTYMEPMRIGKLEEDTTTTTTTTSTTTQTEEDNRI